MDKKELNITLETNSLGNSTINRLLSSYTIFVDQRGGGKKKNTKLNPSSVHGALILS